MISNPLQKVHSYTSTRLVSAESTSPSSSRITLLFANATHSAKNYFFYDSVHSDRRSTDSYLTHSVTILLPHALLLLNLLYATRKKIKSTVPAALILQRCHYPALYKYCVFRGLGIPANALHTYTASWLLLICQVRDPALRSFPLSFYFV